MKKSYVFAAVISAALFFVSCASIPEPKDVSSTLVYGLAKYKGAKQYAGSNTPDYTIKYNDINVKIRNVKTNKSFTMVSNSKGELIKRNVPEGIYIIDTVSVNYEYDERKWWCNWDIDKNDASARFIVRPGVTNFGRIDLDVDYDGRGKIFWARDFDVVESTFKKYHSESEWTNVRWINFNESKTL